MGAPPKKMRMLTRITASRRVCAIERSRRSNPRVRHFGVAVVAEIACCCVPSVVVSWVPTSQTTGAMGRLNATGERDRPDVVEGNEEF